MADVLEDAGTQQAELTPTGEIFASMENDAASAQANGLGSTPDVAGLFSTEDENVLLGPPTAGSEVSERVLAALFDSPVVEDDD